MPDRPARTLSRLLRTALCLSAIVLAACEVNPVVTEDDVPIPLTSTVYELFVLQQDMDRTFNILFVADGSYGDLSVLANRQAFADDAATLIENSYWQNQGYYFNFPHFNYYYSIDTGSVTEQPEDANGNFVCPDVDFPASVDTDGAFADATLLLHTNELRDCASPSSGWATTEPTSFRTAAHETAHAIFGLNDEYCCDSSYSVSEPVMYATESACTSDAVNAAWRNCTSFVGDRDGATWWRSEGSITGSAIMISGGSTVFEFGPGDWVIVDAAYQSLPGTAGPSSTGDPTVIAPADWVRP